MNKQMYELPLHQDLQFLTNYLHILTNSHRQMIRQTLSGYSDIRVARWKANSAGTDTCTSYTTSFVR